MQANVRGCERKELKNAIRSRQWVVGEVRCCCTSCALRGIGLYRVASMSNIETKVAQASSKMSLLNVDIVETSLMSLHEEQERRAGKIGGVRKSSVIVRITSKRGVDNESATLVTKHKVPTDQEDISRCIAPTHRDTPLVASLDTARKQR